MKYYLKTARSRCRRMKITTPGVPQSAKSPAFTNRCTKPLQGIANHCKSMQALFRKKNYFMNHAHYWRTAGCPNSQRIEIPRLRLGVRQSSAAFDCRSIPRAPEDWRSPKPGGGRTIPRHACRIALPPSFCVVRVRDTSPFVVQNQKSHQTNTESHRLFHPASPPLTRRPPKCCRLLPPCCRKCCHLKCCHSTM